MTKLTKKILGRLSLLLFLITVPLWIEAQKPSRKVSKAQKKAEKVDDQQKKAYQAARKKEVKRRFNMQTPEVKARMKQTRKEANGYNKVKKDPFFDRFFQKKKHKKRKKGKKR
ncbi:MAG: hypothetical protein GXO83_01145 [Chlorobi bacterium]|nr:hypothetical protein [Chlorobiota bacterium]